MNRFLGIVCLMLAFVSSAQVVQRGIAVEYNEKAAKTALAGVEFRVQRAGSTASDAKGAFALDFPTLKAGDRVAVRRIEKPGYELFNKEAVEQWNINPSRAFTVVMCRSDKFKALKDRYYSNSEERYAGQYRSAKAELERLKKEGKLKEQEYFARLREVEAEYEKKLDNLDNYVDRFARIDLSELNAEEQAIIDLVQSGQIDEAIERYEKMNITEKLVDGLKKRWEVKEAITALTETEASLTASTDSLYAMAERQTETLLLAGDSHNNPKIAEIYTTIAASDTTNVDWLLKTGEFVYNYIGDYKKALNYYQIALNVSNGIYGEEHSDVAACYINIGNVYDNMGDYLKALEYYEKSLAISKKLLGEEHPAVAGCYNNIGNVYYSMGDYPKALEYYEKSLAIRTKVLGEEHPDVGSCYNNIGNVYDNMGDYLKALEYYEQSLAIRKKILDEEHPYVANCYNNIGNVYESMGEYPKALEYHEKSLAIMKKVLGEEHPDVASIYNNIGTVYSRMGDYPKALDNYEQSMAIQKKVLGEDHPNVATCYHNIGTVYGNMGDYPKALEYFEQSLAIQKKVLGEEHPDVAQDYTNLGMANFYLENYSEAVDYFSKAYAVFSKDEDYYGSQIMALDYNIGLSFAMKGDWANALRYLEHGLALNEKLMGPDNQMKTNFTNIIDAVRAELQSKEGGSDE